MHTAIEGRKIKGRILELHSREEWPEIDGDDLPLHPLYNYIWICGSGKHVHTWFGPVVDRISETIYGGHFSKTNDIYADRSDRPCRKYIAEEPDLPDLYHSFA